MLSCLGEPEGLQKESCPVGSEVHVLDRNTKMVQQLNESLHPCPLESLVSNGLDGTYNELPQPWGGWHQAMKANKVFRAEAK